MPVTARRSAPVAVEYNRSMRRFLLLLLLSSVGFTACSASAPTGQVNVPVCGNRVCEQEEWFVHGRALDSFCAKDCPKKKQACASLKKKTQAQLNAAQQCFQDSDCVEAKAPSSCPPSAVSTMQISTYLTILSKYVDQCGTVPCTDKPGSLITFKCVDRKCKRVVQSRL